MRTRSLLPLAALAAALGFAAPALASPATPIPTKKSKGFAGYRVNAKVAPQNGEVDVTATIVVPKLKCTKAHRAMVASAGLVEDSKTNASLGGLSIGCAHGKAHYFPLLVVNDHLQNFPKTSAHPGDMVTLEASVDSTETTVEVFDHTHMFDKSKTGATYSSFVGYPWIGDLTKGTKSRTLGVPKFGKMRFSTATIDGNPFGLTAPQVRFNLYNSSKAKLKIKTGGYAAGKQAFSTIFKHS